jgi:hypothetical protein
MTKFLEGNVYNTVCKSANTQGATVWNFWGSGRQINAGLQRICT